MQFREYNILMANKTSIPGNQKPQAVVYVRVSTKEQVDGASLDVQERTCVEYAENVLGCEVAGIYREEGESAKTANRTQLNRMLNYISSHKGEIDYAVCYEVDRVTRNNASFQIGIKAFLQKHGVALRYALQTGIDDTPEGKLMETIFVGVAQFENDLKAQKVHDAMSERARQGYWVTQAPLGFMVKTVMPDGTLYDSARGERKKYPKILVPNNKNNLAKNLAEVMNRFSEGDITETQAYKMALDLGIAGAKGIPLKFSRFDNILRSPVYAGYNNSDALLGGEMVKLKFDGLISIETWRRIQLLLDKNKRELKSKDDSLYPLDGTILCLHCGKPYHGDAPRDGSGNLVPRYYCRGGASRGHKYQSVKTDEAHALFDLFLQQLTPNEGTVRLFKEILKRTAYKKLTEATSRLNGITKQQARLKEKKNKALESLLDGKLTVEEKDSLIGSLDAQLQDLEARRVELEQQQTLNGTTIEYVCNFIDKPAKLWRDADLESKHALQKVLFPNGLHIDLKAKKCRTADLSPLYSVIGTKNEPEGSENSTMVISRRVELLLTG